MPACGVRPIATGNWGCGVFGGDPQLKSLLQWVAASKARCPKLIYYTFNDRLVGNAQVRVSTTDWCISACYI